MQTSAIISQVCLTELNLEPECCTNCLPPQKGEPEHLCTQPFWLSLLPCCVPGSSRWHSHNHFGSAGCRAVYPDAQDGIRNGRFLLLRGKWAG